jgi:hypothetical protein
MKYLSSLLLLLLLASCSFSQSVSKEDQIAEAVQAAPADLRGEATVKGYNSDGNLVVIRKGTNVLICLADDPNRDGFNSACYHKDLEPFMARSRELRAEGKTNGEIFQIKEEEVQAGTLKMPTTPTALHILSGSEGKYNVATGEVDNVDYRYVVYIPYATEESSGLPLKPVVSGGPWLMNPGTHRAHIMISTPPQN